MQSQAGVNESHRERLVEEAGKNGRGKEGLYTQANFLGLQPQVKLGQGLGWPIGVMTLRGKLIQDRQRWW